MSGPTFNIFKEIANVFLNKFKAAIGTFYRAFRYQLIVNDEKKANK